MVKRLMDIALAAAALLLPHRRSRPARCIALLVRCKGGKGPVLLRQERMTLDGKTFEIFKFRTMVDEAERETGPVFATSDDPRRTRHRRLAPAQHNLDELPQILNVLLGHMSLVGPAPRAPALRPAVPRAHPRVHAPPPRQERDHRLGPGQRLARQHLDREAHRVRPLLHRELVAAARPQDPDPDPLPGLRPEARLLTDSDLAKERPACPEHSSPAPPASSARTSPSACSTEGFSVIGMDNLVTGRPRQHRAPHRARLRLRQARRHELHQHRRARSTTIFHFASPASPIDYLKLPIQTLKVGSLGTHNCLGLAKAKGARFLLASTSEVYGDPLVHPQREDYWGNVNPIGPRGVYDEAKRFAEAMTMAYHRAHGVETRIVRIFNTYGPRMRVEDGRAIPAFMSQALRGEDVTVFGDGIADPQPLLRLRPRRRHLPPDDVRRRPTR